MKIGTLTVNGGKFRSPCVYEFLRAGIVLYVGRSDAGFSRAFRGYSSRRNEARRIAFEQAEEIRVTVFDNTDEANAEEVRLIKLHTPGANVHFNRGR